MCGVQRKKRPQDGVPGNNLMPGRVKRRQIESVAQPHHDLFNVDPGSRLAQAVANHACLHRG
jgi:hypothetical protein